MNRSTSFQTFFTNYLRSFFIGKYPPTPPGGYWPVSFGGKKIKGREKREK
jgi:hypothetical protein